MRLGQVLRERYANPGVRPSAAGDRNSSAGARAEGFELSTGWIFVEGADDRRYTVTFNNLRATALSPSRSIDLIKEVTRPVLLSH